MRAVLLRCPYCMGGFDLNDAIARCSRCNALHHRSCWEENHHCSVFACNGSPCRSEYQFRRWVEYAPAVFLLFVSLNPALLIPFGFLWFPAVICATIAATRFFHKLLHSTLNTIQVPALVFALNLAGIVAILLRLMGP